MTSSNDTPKIALITGATGGIGKATSLLLAKEGYSLALHYNTAAKDTVDALVSSITSIHQSHHPDCKVAAFQANLCSTEAVEKLHSEVVAELCAPSVLFLNAGTTASKSGVASIGDVSLQAFEETWRVNCLAPYQLSQLCLPAMLEAGWGRVIFNSSVAGFTGGVVGPHYASSKSALHGLIHWLAGNVAAKGVTVNGVAPALIEDTAMLPGGGEELAKKIPVGRFGRPQEIAETVVWMVRNGFVTNKVIGVDGGMFPQ